MAAPYLSIVIPAYNEEERIGETLSTLHDYLAKQPYTWEVIVVDDGSRDATGAIVRRWAADHDGFRIETLPHRGKGAAVRHGMLSATGDHRFTCLASNANLRSASQSCGLAGTGRLLSASVTAGADSSVFRISP